MNSNINYVHFGLIKMCQMCAVHLYNQNQSVTPYGRNVKAAIICILNQSIKYRYLN